MASTKGEVGAKSFVCDRAGIFAEFTSEHANKEPIAELCFVIFFVSTVTFAALGCNAAAMDQLRWHAGQSSKKYRANQFITGKK